MMMQFVCTARSVKLELCVAYDAPRFFLPGFLYGRNRGEAPDPR